MSQRNYAQACTHKSTFTLTQLSVFLWFICTGVIMPEKILKHKHYKQSQLALHQYIKKAKQHKQSLLKSPFHWLNKFQNACPCVPESMASFWLMFSSSVCHTPTTKQKLNCCSLACEVWIIMLCTSPFHMIFLQKNAQSQKSSSNVFFICYLGSKTKHSWSLHGNFICYLESKTKHSWSLHGNFVCYLASKTKHLWSLHGNFICYLGSKTKHLWSLHWNFICYLASKTKYLWSLHGNFICYLVSKAVHSWSLHWNHDGSTTF